MKFAAYVALAFLLLVGGFIVRLAYGPVSISALDDYLATAISEAFDGADVHFGATQLAWRGADGTLEVIFSEVEINASRQLQEDRNRTAYRLQLSEIGLGLSKTALLQGRLEPKRLDLYGSDLEVSWSASALKEWAHARFDKPKQPTPTIPVGEVLSPPQRNVLEIGPLADALRSLMRPPAEGERLGFLEWVSLTSGNVRVIERDSGAEWLLRDAHVQFNRRGGDALVEAKMALDAAGQTSALSIVTSNGENGNKRIAVDLQALNPAILARDVGLEGMFLALDLPLFGNFTGEVTDKGSLKSIEIDIGAGTGTVDVPALYPERRDLSSGSLVGRYDVAASQLFVESLYLAAAGGEATADGVIDFSDPSGKADVKLFATVKNLSVKSVLEYWTTRISPTTHGWISRNVTRGKLIEAKFELAMEPHMWGMRPVPASAVRIDFAFEDATAHFLRPMPPLTKASGRATFNTDVLDLTLDSGSVDGIPLSEAGYRLDNAGYRGKQHATVRLRMAAGVKDFLRLVDHQPLGYTTRFNIPADKLFGDASAVIHLSFPQRRGNKIGDVEVNVEADIANGAMPSILKGGGLTEAAVRLNLDKRGIHANGRAKLNGVAFNVYWTELFGDVEPGVMTTRYELAGDLTPEELARFAGPVDRFIDGKVHVDVEMDGLRGVPVRGNGEIDFFGASIVAKKLAWTKPANTPGKAEFEFRWAEDTLDIDRMELKAEGMETVGSYSFSVGTGDLLVARIETLITVGNDLQLTAVRHEGGEYEMNVIAKRIDARPFLEDLLVESTGKAPPMTLDISADFALALNGVGMEGVKLHASNSGEYWTAAELDMNLTGGSPVSMKLEGGESQRQLFLFATDAGRFARGAGLFLNGYGGELDVVAEMNAKGEPSYIEGMLRIANFSVVKSSRLVGEIAARTGKDVDKYLDDGGIKFDKLRLPFRATEGVIDIPDARANGPSIGFTLQGQVNRRTKQINLNGAIVPVYALNSLLGKVPIVGSLFTGGKGGGLFALAYRIEGSASEPKVDINPLSALAPGFLRKIFEGPKGTVDVDDVEEEVDEESEEGDPGPEG